MENLIEKIMDFGLTEEEAENLIQDVELEEESVGDVVRNHTSGFLSEEEQEELIQIFMLDDEEDWEDEED